MEKLDIYPDSGTSHRNDEGQCERLKFYESGICHSETGEPLVYVISIGGDGMRMTRTQVEDLVEWLNDWLAQ